MTATEAQWQKLQAQAQTYRGWAIGPAAACALELRDRIAALETHRHSSQGFPPQLETSQPQEETKTEPPLTAIDVWWDSLTPSQRHEVWKTWYFVPRSTV